MQCLWCFYFKTASIMFLSNILFELLDVEHGSSISREKCNSLGPALALDLPPSRGEFCTLQFPDTTLYKPQNEIC